MKTTRYGTSCPRRKWTRWNPDSARNFTGPYPIANCEAADVKTLKKEFRASIDEYLASCAEDGVEPKKPFSGNLNLDIGPDLHHRITLSATAEGMSVNSWVKLTLEKQVGG